MLGRYWENNGTTTLKDDVIYFWVILGTLHNIPRRYDIFSPTMANLHIMQQDFIIVKFSGMSCLKKLGLLRF